MVCCIEFEMRIFFGVLMRVVVLKDNFSAGRLVFGVDEAGRGPIVGPMVIACVGFLPLDVVDLINIGVADSKSISRSTRERLFPRIISLASAVVVSYVDPRAIDEWVLNGRNLNRLEAWVISKILEKIPRGNIFKIFIDAPSGLDKFVSYLKEFNVFGIVAEHKADVFRPVVSAASIVAKVLRDREIDKIKEEIGVDFGSGYLTDPKTRKFINYLMENYPNVIRKSWRIGGKA